MVCRAVVGARVRGRVHFKSASDSNNSIKQIVSLERPENQPYEKIISTLLSFFALFQPWVWAD